MYVKEELGRGPRTWQKGPKKGKVGTVMVACQGGTRQGTKDLAEGLREAGKGRLGR